MSQRRRITGMIVTAVFGLTTLTACERERATRFQCEEIFERLIILELREMGFNDAELSKRWIARLRRRYRAELEECVGKGIPAEAMRCIESAKSAEVLSHTCLR